MRTLYLDCFSGLSGDMLLGALLAVGADEQFVRQGLAKLPLAGWDLQVAGVERSGISALDVTVKLLQAQEHGRHLPEIVNILTSAELPAQALQNALAVFNALANAEATVHGTTPDKIHFHEVGAIDAIVDITGVCLALHSLSVQNVLCAPLPMGRGFVECAHGLIPLPAPAVVELTRGFEVYGVEVEGELVTPTGAAIVTTLAQCAAVMPAMLTHVAGYGAGKKLFGPRPNLLRAVVGETMELASEATEIVGLETNVDDMSPELYELLMERALAAGALDVFLTPIQMKKGRPATQLTILAPLNLLESMTDLIFSETTTLGVRFSKYYRVCQTRTRSLVQTPYGPVHVKQGSWKGAVTTVSPEYDDVKRAATGHNVPAKVVYEAALAAWKSLPATSEQHGSADE